MRLADTWVDDWRASVARWTPRSRPFVTAAFALSADDCLSQQRGRSTTLSSPEALRVTHLLRAMNDAVLVGLGTVLADDPLLTTRLVAGPTGQRVVLDSGLRTPATARLLTSKQRPVVIFSCPPADGERLQTLRAAGAEIEQLAASDQGIDLPSMLERLKARGAATVMVEGGARVLESFFSHGLVDYVSLTRAPRRVRGPESVPLGPRALEALCRWNDTITLSLGVDRVTFGRL